MLSRVHISVDFDLLLGADYTAPATSCTQHQVYEQTDLHDAYGGMPESYCFENTKIHQIWWNKDQLDYEDLGQQLGMEVVTVSTIRQPPGCVIPYHRDTFYRIKQQYPDRDDLLIRANVFLEPCGLGHFLQYTIDDRIETVVGWQAGDALIWDSSILHLGANAGMQNKHTMQVSGFAR